MWCECCPPAADGQRGTSYRSYLGARGSGASGARWSASFEARDLDGPRTLLIDPMDGEPTQRLATGAIIAANWSADGRRVLFVTRRIPAIESVPALVVC
jgi:hypothetical protein